MGGGGGGSGVNQRANGCKSCCGWMWERTGGKNLPPWTRVPSVAVVQQRAKEQQRQRQPFHTSGISQDSLNRTPPGFVLRQGRGRREREGGGEEEEEKKKKTMVKIWASWYI